MAIDKTYQPSYPLAPSILMPRSDQESATNFQYNNQLRKKNRIKSIFLYTIILTVIILIFTITFIRIKSPKIRLEDVRVSNDGDANINFVARVMVKNRNFWRYEFDSTLATITSGGETIGEFVIPEATVRAHSTKKFYVTANIVTTSRLRVNSTSGILPVTSQAMLRGKVKVLKVFRRKKSADLRCTMSINLTLSVIQDLDCQ